MSSQIYNRHILTMHRDRAARDLFKHDFLFNTSAEDIVDRVMFYNKDYENVLDLGCRTGHFSRYALGKINFNNLYQTDISKEMLRKVSGIRVNCDEENLPFADKTFDLVVSNLNLHWINDMIGTLTQIKEALRPGGLFVSTFIGGKSLKTLREFLIKIELEAGIKVGFHASPMITGDAMVRLAQMTGFTGVVVDSQLIQVNYSSPLSAMKELQKMGESNCMQDKVQYFGKKNLKHLQSNIAPKLIRIDFEIITLSAFKAVL